MTTPVTPGEAPPPARPDRGARAHSFNAAAAQYAANRPSYPPALLDALEELAGRPLAGDLAIDVAAETLPPTPLPHPPSPDTLSVAPGAGMAAESR
ncbi:SAM-dependent methyltransferase, partial [Streptomyces parvulus]